MSKLRDQMLQVMQQTNFSPNTIRTYISCLVGLSKHYNKSPDELSVQQINDFLHYCSTEKGLSNSMINQTIGALKFLTINVLKREWKSLDIPRPKREKRLPDILSKEEVSKIISVTKNLKHKTLIMLAYSAGLRLNEALNLVLSDIDSQRMQIIVRQAKYTALQPILLRMELILL